MSGKVIDLTGRRFGRLTVISHHHKNSYDVSYWLCKCDCGKVKVVRGSAMTTGIVKSCGCYNQELRHLRKTNFKHGFSHKERLYDIWENMKRRCNSPKNARYDFYGGKGISVCNEWLHDYVSFRLWALSNGYSDSLTIDRINNNGNYEPSNCRWATAKVQENNMSRNHILYYNGVSHTISEWASILGMTYSAVNHRVQRRWSMERIVLTPQRNKSGVADA